MRSIVALAVLVLLAACASPVPSPTSWTDVPFEPTTADRDFALTVRTPSLVWRANQPIELTAELSYVGPAGSATAVGSGSGLVSFSLEQLDGPLDVAAAATGDCVPYTFRPAEPTVIPYAKSGGWSAGDSNAGLIEAYMRDPQFRLPAGSYRVTVAFSADEGDCGGPRHILSVEVPLSILP